MAHAVAWSLYKMRRDVGRIPYGFFKASKKLGVTVLVDVEGGKDLVPVTIWDAHQMSIFDIAKKCHEIVQKAKVGKDKAHNESTNLANFIPSFLIEPLMFSATYIAAVLGISVDTFSLKADRLGHIVLTNVGTLGFNAGVAPLAPPLHQMALLCTGKIEKKVIVDQVTNEIKVGHMMTTIATGDHRYGDAAIFAPFYACFLGFLNDPANFDPTIYKENAHYKELKDG